VPLLNLTLGTREQNTLTMATVMATIANRGMHHAPVMVQRVVTPDGQVLIDETAAAGDPAVPIDVADCMQTVLSHTVTSGTGGNARVGGQTIFGKTGTTDNRTDAWFIGANPGGAGRQLATAVWFGNRTGYVRGAGFGGDSAAPVFQAFMSAALAGEAAAGLPAPGPVCARSGSFVNPDGGRTTINPSAPVEPAPPALPTAQEQPTEPTVAAVPDADSPGNSGQ
jgi:membrane peptidoglycan carboxypeptidase